MARALRWPQDDGTEKVVLVMDEDEAYYVASELGGGNAKVHGIVGEEPYFVLSQQLSKEELKKHLEISMVCRPEYHIGHAKDKAVELGVITEEFWGWFKTPEGWQLKE